MREYVEGIPADLRAGRMTSIRPWELVAEVAAAVHAIAVDGEQAGWIGGHATRRAHRESSLQSLTDLEDDENATVRAAVGWLRENLGPDDPDEPPALVHGDLLGQNILLYPGEPVGVIDWEFAALGDPAYDLAIVTRGARKPLQLADGFDKLLTAYERLADRPVRAREVRFHEMCLNLQWCREDRGRPEQHVNKLRNLLRSVRHPA